jgi:hypothetical protein
MRNTEHIATYYYDNNASGQENYEIMAIYDSVDEYDRRKPSYYEIYDKSGSCLNEGYPLYSMPEYIKVYEQYLAVSPLPTRV